MFDVLDLYIPGKEFWNSELQEFIYTKDITLHLKHSLISLTRWEQHYKRRFLDDGPKNEEEYRFYIQCMTLNKDVDPLVYTVLQEDDIKKVTDYLHDSMTATTLPKQNDKPNKGERLSSELIYYYMSALNIPFECEKWFLNNLIILISIASIKNNAQEKKSKPSWSSIRARNAARNAKARG